MVNQVILIDLWQLVSKALTKENKFWFSTFFCNVSNTSWEWRLCGKGMNDLVKILNKI